MEVYVVFYDNREAYEDHNEYLESIFKNKDDAKAYCYDNNGMIRLLDECYNIEMEVNKVRKEKEIEYSSKCIYKKGKKNEKMFYECRNDAIDRAKHFIEDKYKEKLDRITELHDIIPYNVGSYSYQTIFIQEEYAPDKNNILSQEEE